MLSVLEEEQEKDQSALRFNKTSICVNPDAWRFYIRLHTDSGL